MFENEANGYKRSEVDYYIKRLDEDFKVILKSHTERIDNVKRNLTDLAKEIGEYQQAIPQYKSEIESLRERILNIRGWAEAASKIRYLQNTDIDAVLANLITQILLESDNIEQLKPLVKPKPVKSIDSEDFFEILASDSNVKLEDALRGFDFYDDNPYRATAEKRLAKIEKRKTKKK